MEPSLVASEQGGGREVPSLSTVEVNATTATTATTAADMIPPSSSASSRDEPVRSPLFFGPLPGLI